MTPVMNVMTTRGTEWSCDNTTHLKFQMLIKSHCYIALQYTRPFIPLRVTTFESNKDCLSRQLIKLEAKFVQKE